MILKFPTKADLSPTQLEAVSSHLGENILVEGPPGSGKTLAAVYRAIALEQMGLEVRFLTFNKLLSRYLKEMSEHTGIHVNCMTATGWATYVWRSNFGDRHIPEVGDWKSKTFDYKRFAELLVEKKENQGVLNAVSHLVIDEGQDLPNSFYNFLRKTQYSVSVFADENQIITSENSTLSQLDILVDPVAKVSINRNYRNSQEIADFANGFYAGESTGIPATNHLAKSGILPSLTNFPSFDDEVFAIVKHEFINPDEYVGVAFPTRQILMDYKSALEKYSPRNPLQVYLSKEKFHNQDISFDRPGLKLFTYKSAKGLEFETMFVPGLQSLTLKRDWSVPDKKTFFVLASRARKSLMMSYVGAETPEMFAYLNPQTFEIRTGG